jgi:lipoic acid synthetase
VAAAVAELGLAYCVLTMVSRDDLADGGAAWVAATMVAVRRRCPGVRLEALVSDLGGDAAALARVLAAGPEVLNHNLETVPRLYGRVRPQADYGRSLTLLARVRALAPAAVIKSGLMLGLGEEPHEVLAAMDDLRAAGCQALTLGQYLAPSAAHLPMARYLPPEEFAWLGQQARGKGFLAVASAPLVRSSHGAEGLYAQARPRPPAGP